MINRKQEFLESARIIYEDVMEEGLNDFIILGETFSDDVKELDVHEDDKSNPNEDNMSDMDLNNMPMSDADEDEESEEPEEEPNFGHDLLSEPMNDDLPTPIGRQTGEPLNDDIDDLMYVTLDLKSNTMSDILPVPPNNANEALSIDDIKINVDSGFESTDDVKKLNEIEEKSKKKTDSAWNTVKKTVSEDDALKESAWLEAISLDSPPIPNPTATSTPDASVAPTPAGGEVNDVTAAVLDKVNELDSTGAPDTNLNVTPEMDMSTSVNDMAEPNDDAKKNDSELLKKLSSITDNIEAAKRMIINNIQK